MTTRDEAITTWRSGQATLFISARTSFRNCTAAVTHRGIRRAGAAFAGCATATRAALPSADPGAPSVARAINFPQTKKDSLSRPVKRALIIPGRGGLSTHLTDPDKESGATAPPRRGEKTYPG